MTNKQPWPANVPPIPPDALRWDDVRSRVHYTVFDAGDCRWRMSPRGLVTFIRYSDGRPAEIVRGPAYKHPTHREGAHVVSDFNGHCTRCGCSQEARQDNLPETKTCRSTR